MLAYNAEKTISETIKRLPLSDKNYDLEILIVDDASSDNTFIKAKKSKKNNSNLKITILRNPVNQGFGGNVKIGKFSAISLGANIMHNIEIGEHSVVGAGSLVNENINDLSVCYGVPAKFIRSRKIGEKYLLE